MLFGAYERDAAILLTEEYGWMKKYLHSLEEVDAKSDFFRFPLEDEFLLCECDDLSKEEKVFPILFLLRNLIELVIFNGYWSVVVVRCRQIEALLYRSLTQKRRANEWRIEK